MITIPLTFMRSMVTRIVAIETLAIIAGKLRPRATGLVIEWASLHQDELRHDWEQARNNQPLDPIDPLP